MTHLRIAVIIALLTLLAASASAQAGTSSTTPAPCPLYSAGAFLGFNHYDNPQIKGGGFFDTQHERRTASEADGEHPGVFSALMGRRSPRFLKATQTQPWSVPTPMHISSFLRSALRSRK